MSDYEISMSDRKRRYVSRKRFLREAADHIKDTLEFIHRYKGNQVNIPLSAREYSQRIEAACWYPNAHFTPDAYKTLVEAKTAQLCRALLAQNFSEFELGQIALCECHSLKEVEEFLQVKPVFPTRLKRPSHKKPSIDASRKSKQLPDNCLSLWNTGDAEEQALEDQAYITDYLPIQNT